MNVERAATRVVQAGALAVVLAALPYKTFDLDRYFVPKELVLGLTAGIAALLVLRRSLTPTRVDALLVAYLALSTASAATAVNGWLAWRALAVSLGGAAMFWIARALARAGKGRALLGGVAFAVVIAAGTALFQAYGGHGDFLSLNRAPGGTLGNRNFIAHVAAIGLPVLVLLAFDARLLGRVAATVGIGVVAWALVLSRSRAAWLAVGLAAALALAVALRHRLPVGRSLTIAAAAGIGALAAVALPNSLHWRSRSPYLDSALGVADYREGSGHGRLVQYGGTVRMARAHPLLGVGPGNWPVAYPKYAAPNDPSLDDESMTANPWPSSDWAAFVSERGVLATACLALALLALAASRGAPLALTATILTVAVVGCFDAVLLLPTPTLLVWATLGALAPAPSRSVQVLLRAPLRTLTVGVIAILGVAAVGRSAQQAVAMALANDTTSERTLEFAARVDPGSYRLHMRAAEEDERRGRCAAATAQATTAHHLFPAAPAPRHVLARCR